MNAAAQPLAGHHALVTGGGRGIGRAIAASLAELGATLTLLGRDETRLREVAAAQAATSHCDWHVCDVTDAAAVARSVAAVRAAGHRVSILVNNAGSAISATLANTEPAIWNDMLQSNLTSAYLCTRALLPGLLEAEVGRVVNIASTAGLVGYRHLAAYCAAKHGLIGLTRALALELAPTRITVNAVCPGYTDTDMVADAVANIVAQTGKTSSEARAALTGRNPQKRLVRPDEVAATVAWLCLPASQAITGQALSVSGGEVMTG